MDGKDKINGANSDSGFYQSFWKGISNWVGQYKQYTVTATDSEDSGIQLTGLVTGTSPDKPQRQVSLAELSEETFTSTYSDEFTELMTDALWNICEDPASDLQHKPETDISNPEQSLGIHLPDVLQKSDEDMLEQSYEVVEMDAVDQEMSRTMDHYYSILGGLDSINWGALSEAEQESIIADVLKLTTFLDSVSVDVLAKSLCRIIDSSDSGHYQKSLKEKMMNMSSFRQQLASLFDRSTPVLRLLSQLQSHLRTEYHRSQMDSLSGEHLASEVNWETTNRIASMEPGPLNSDGTAQQFDTDILRKSNFALFDKSGLSFHSAVCQFECRQDSSKTVDENDERFKEECRKQLLSLCEGKPDALKGVLTDLVSQSPYNPLGNTLRVMAQEQLGEFHVFAPQERKFETQIHKGEDGSLNLRFVLAFPSYKLTTEEGHCFHIKQPVTITSSMNMSPPEFVKDRKLGEIKVVLGKVVESSLYDG
ncbi:hypothetical protein [Endozoicomonas arenosclerae]|uniref:hypothetical protein n=1 Tax=Endozoicomonas arenosclerae TaxID=1633495 RepID=UPI000781F840|nr:hypothetical protein [Endozoicomonas arenosclerae]